MKKFKNRLCLTCLELFIPTSPNQKRCQKCQKGHATTMKYISTGERLATRRKLLGYLSNPVPEEISWFGTEDLYVNDFQEIGDLI